MRKIPFILILLFSLQSYSQNPSSARSWAAIKKVTPLLQTQLHAKGLKFGSSVFIRIFKETDELEIWIRNEKQYTLFKIFQICNYGSKGLGPKLKEGDGRAPEGFYQVSSRSLNPSSAFHLSFNLGYPNEYDRAHSRTGGALMVHGACASIGCYAMTNEGIEEIYSLVDAALGNGQKIIPVHIFPFRMDEDNLSRFEDSQWFAFWGNLKRGYELFEKSKTPPRVNVRKGEYSFGEGN